MTSHEKPSAKLLVLQQIEKRERNAVISGSKAIATSANVGASLAQSFQVPAVLVRHAIKELHASGCIRPEVAPRRGSPTRLFLTDKGRDALAGKMPF